MLLVKESKVDSNGLVQLQGKDISDLLSPLPNDLRYLSLFNNKLVGSLSLSPALSSTLTYLLLNDNALTGSIPDFSAVSSVRILNLANNAFTSFANVACLKNFTSLSTLRLDGLPTLPPTSLDSLSLPASLSFLRLDGSHFVGDGTSSVSLLPSLRVLWLPPTATLDLSQVL